MTPEELAAIEARARLALDEVPAFTGRAVYVCQADIPALVAEVKRLREALWSIGHPRPDGSAGPDLRGCITIARAALTQEPSND